MPLYRLVKTGSIDVVPKGDDPGVASGAIDHVLGVGGSGMMPLALLLAASGRVVSGADRGFDRDPGDDRALDLARAGIRLLPQNALPPIGARVVVSTAIEPDHPALAGGAPTAHRSVALKELLDDRPVEDRILVAGSSGKTTTTAMIAWILAVLGRDPLVYVGGEVPGLAPRGARWGSGPSVVEVDESDGSIERFTAGVGVVTSVSEDHKPLVEIERLFREFLGRARSRLMVPAAAHLAGSEATVVAPLLQAASPLLGAFNRANEALAIAAAGQVGVSEPDARRALASFPGVGRRLQIVRSGDIMVVDDFAHNPEKVSASLAALRSLERPIGVIFQPHGYGPTRMHAAGFGRTFKDGLGPADRLLLLPIHDAGGSADRSIRAEAILDNAPGLAGDAARDRDEALAWARDFAAAAGDRAVIAVMGARDPSLSSFAREIARTV